MTKALADSLGEMTGEDPSMLRASMSKMMENSALGQSKFKDPSKLMAGRSDSKGRSSATATTPATTTTATSSMTTSAELIQEEKIRTCYDRIGSILQLIWSWHGDRITKVYHQAEAAAKSGDVKAKEMLPAMLPQFTMWKTFAEYKAQWFTYQQAVPLQTGAYDELQRLLITVQPETKRAVPSSIQRSLLGRGPGSTKTKRTGHLDLFLGWTKDPQTPLGLTKMTIRDKTEMKDWYVSNALSLELWKRSPTLAQLLTRVNCRSIAYAIRSNLAHVKHLVSEMEFLIHIGNVHRKLDATPELSKIADIVNGVYPAMQKQSQSQSPTSGMLDFISQQLLNPMVQDKMSATMDDLKRDPMGMVYKMLHVVHDDDDGENETSSASSTTTTAQSAAGAPNTTDAATPQLDGQRLRELYKKLSATTLDGHAFMGPLASVLESSLSAVSPSAPTSTTPSQTTTTTTTSASSDVKTMVAAVATAPTTTSASASTLPPSTVSSSTSTPIGSSMAVDASVTLPHGGTHSISVSSASAAVPMITTPMSGTAMAASASSSSSSSDHSRSLSSSSSSSSHRHRSSKPDKSSKEKSNDGSTSSSRSSGGSGGSGGSRSKHRHSSSSHSSSSSSSRSSGVK